MNPTSHVWLNGRLVPSEQAIVSVFDRSFLYGDGLFETIAVRGGQPVRWDAHIERLVHGADFLRIQLPFEPDVLRTGAERLIESTALQSGTLRIHLSRGVGLRGYSPRGANQPTVLVTAHPAAPGSGDFHSWRLKTASFRIAAGDPLAAHKTASKLLQVLARAEAETAGADEALILNTDGNVVESSSGNLFWIEGQTLHTPPVSDGLLPGVTRGAILELAPAAGLTAFGTTAKPDRLLRSDGAFLTMSSLGVVEIAQLDGIPLPSSPHARNFWERLRSL
jgi:branched-chain amino acid aminotransferase